MTNGNFFLNYKNAFDHFGVLVADGGYKGFFSPPKLKKIESNDWPEEDGIEADLSDPVFDGRTVQVDFICVDASKMEAFFSELIAPGYHVFDLSEFGTSFSLRYVEEKKNKRLKNGEVFSLNFSEDIPLDGYVYTAPAPVILSPQTYTLDGVNLSSGYGILVGGNTDDEFRQKAAVKENLKVSAGNEAGVIYDTGIIKLKSRNAEASILFRSPTTAVFWQNYQAFLFNLKAPGVKSFETPDGAYSCFYNNGDAKRVERLRGGGVWCELKLKFTIL